MDYGHEFLGAAKYEKFAIQNLPAGRCGKTFSKEFGPSQTVLRRWAEKGVHPVIMTQGLWRGGNHDYSGDRIMNESLKELEKFINIAQDFPTQQFQYSPYCEHKLGLTTLKKVFTEHWKIVKNFPNVQLINNPMPGGSLLKPEAFGILKGSLYNEIHGTWNPKMSEYGTYMWGCDGIPAQDCDIQMFKNRHSKAGIIWLWMQQYNCKKKVDDTTPIAQRRVKPVLKQVISLEHLFPDKGNTGFHRNSLYKTHADQHGNTPTGREQKPVIMSSVKADKLEFTNSNGRVVHTAKYAGTYTDGRAMYRATLWGYEIQEKARESGSTLTGVTAIKRGSNTLLGIVNPAFRENAYRLSSDRRLYTLHEDQETLTTIDDYFKINPDWV